MKKFSNYKKICLCVVVLILCMSTALAGYETLRYGDRSNGVKSMQLALKELGYTIVPDGIYGGDTKAVVKRFQAAQKLFTDGIAGNLTLSRLYELEPSFSQGGGNASGTITPSQRARVETTGGTLTLRKTQSTGASALARIPHMTTIDVISKGKTWTKAMYAGKIGYVLTSYLNFNYSNSGKPGTTTPPTAKTTARVETTGGTLTLRASQSTRANALSLIPHMTIIQIVQKGSTWSKATYAGKTGYVLTSYLNYTYNQTPPSIQTKARVQTTGGTLTLRATQSTRANALAFIPHMTVIDIVQKGTTWSKVHYNGKTGYVLTSYLNYSYNSSVVPPVTSSTKARVETTGGTLTLRSRKSTGGSALARIPHMTVINVIDRESTWTKTTYAGKTGYVLTSYLNFKYQSATPNTPPPTTGMKARVQTTGGKLTFRSAPSTSSAPLGYIPHLTVIDILEKGTSWAKALYGGKVGYVYSSYLNYQFQNPTPTPNKVPTPTPPSTTTYNPSDFPRTLRFGYTGSDVNKVQEKLQSLKYLSTVTKMYDTATMNAVKKFQSLNGLTVDGLAGKATFTKLFSGAVVPFDTNMETYQHLSIYYGADKPPEAEVRKMQTALLQLGYNVKVNGSYEELTHNAVVAFQLRNGMTPEGDASPALQALLFSGNAKHAKSAPAFSLGANAGWMESPDTDDVQLLHWFKDVKPNVKGGNILKIYDPDTSLSWKLRLFSAGNHADVEPYTLEDTLIMNKSFGSTSWNIHPVYVQIPSGKWVMATMHNRPHLSGGIKDNGFDGHLCVHFFRDLVECKKNDPYYGVNNQEMLRKAWKELTGETITE